MSLSDTTAHLAQAQWMAAIIAAAGGARQPERRGGRRGSMPDLEAAVLARRRRALALHPLDARQPRPARDRRRELGERRLGTLGDQLHRPVGAVAHPAGEAEALGL